MSTFMLAQGVQATISSTHSQPARCSLALAMVGQAMLQWSEGCYFSERIANIPGNEKQK